MKTLVPILLVALLCAERAQGLRCYQCFAYPYLGPCEVQTCPFPDGVCVSQAVTVGNGSEEMTVFNKFCLPSCMWSESYHRNVPESVLPLTSELACCQRDLCNAAGPAASRPRVPAVAFVLSLGAVLLCHLLG